MSSNERVIVTPSVLDIPEHGTMHWCKGFEIPATKTVPTVYQSSKTVKNSQKTAKTAKMTIGVPIVTCLHRVRRIHKVSVRVRRPRPPNTQSPNVTVSARNLHFSAPLSHLTPPMGWILLSYLIQIWHRKTRVHGLQSGAGYIMLDLAILIQYVNVTDTQSDTV